MRTAFATYAAASAANISPLETELAAFHAIIQELEQADTDRARVRALGRNHELWSILVRDLALGGNGLPEAIKAQLIQLGTWSMQYSTRALLQPLDLHPLIEVNRNIADGLAAQRAKPDGVTPGPRTAPQQHGRLEISGA